MMTEKQWKYYRDIKNVTDTAFEEGKEKMEIQIVLNAMQKGYTAMQIFDLTASH